MYPASSRLLLLALEKSKKQPTTPERGTFVNPLDGEYCTIFFTMKEERWKKTDRL